MDSPTRALHHPEQIIVARAGGGGLAFVIDGQQCDLPVTADPGPAIHPATRMRPYEMVTVTLIAKQVSLVTLETPRSPHCGPGVRLDSDGAPCPCVFCTGGCEHCTTEPDNTLDAAAAADLDEGDAAP